MHGGKHIVTLRSAPSETVEVPEEVKVRSCFGALRLFPGVPKAVTKEELKHIETARPDVFERLEVRPYVESRRVDLRGVSEAEIAALARTEGLEHLRPAEQVRQLRERGKLPK
jgi:hypothetical protein